MTVLEPIVSSGPWLGVTLLQATLIGLLGMIAWLMVRRLGPALRGAVVLAALVGMLVVPALALVAPVWLQLPDLAQFDSVVAEQPRLEKVAPTLRRSPVKPAMVASVPAPAASKPAPGLEGLLEPFEDVALSPEKGALPLDPVTLPDEPIVALHPSEPGQDSWSGMGVLASLWLIGAGACLFCALARLGFLYHVAWRARLVRQFACLHALAQHYEMRAPRLRESAAIGSPLTMGLLRPVILLPSSWRNWSTEQRELILTHELAHVRRGDFLAGLAAELALCLFWFHPLVRWLVGRLRLEQEFAADAWAASATSDAMNYVRCLARLALEPRQGSGSLAPAFWRRRPEILRRIDMLRRNPHGQPAHLGRGTACTLLALAAAACLAVAGIGPLQSVAEAMAEEPRAAESVPEVKAAATADLYGDPLPAGTEARLGTTRWRHGATITYLSFGADGKTLITAGQDSTVRLWDLETGRELRRFVRPRPAETRPVARPAAPQGGAAPQADADLQKLRELLQKARQEAEKAQQAASAEKDPDKAKEALAKARAAIEKAQQAADKARQAQQVQAQQALAQRRAPANTSSFSVAFAPDGKTLAVATATVIQLYDVQSGDEVRKIQGPAQGLVSLLFSPDSRTLAARTGDGLILWETETGNELRQIKLPQQPANRQVVAVVDRAFAQTSGLAFSADGKMVAAATMEPKEQSLTGALKLWDVATGDVMREIKGPEGVTISAVSFSPDGKFLGYCTNQVVHLCEADTGKEIRQFDAPEPTTALLFSPDSKTLATHGRSARVRIWDVATGKETLQLGAVDSSDGAQVLVAARFVATPETRTLSFSPDGKRMATATGGTVRIWDAGTGKELPLSEGHQGSLSGIVLAPDGKTVVSWGADRVVRRWDAATGKTLNTFRLPSGTQATALAPDGQTVAVSYGDGAIRIHDMASGKEVHQLKGFPSGAAALAFAPDGKTIAARSNDNLIRVYDVAQGGELRQMAAQPVSNAGSGNVVIVNGAARFGTGGRSGLAFSPDGKLLAASSSTGATAFPGAVPPGTRGARAAINLYDVATGKVIRKIEPAQTVVSYVFSPDGRVLATENADQSITLWEVASGKQRSQLGQAVVPAQPPVAALPGAVAFRLAGPVVEPAGPATLTFSPDGRTLAARDSGNSLRVWDVIEGKEIGTFRGHEGRIETIAAAANGKTFATGSADTTILLWNAATLLKDLPQLQPVELAADAIEPLWNDLAAEDGGKALDSVLKLAGAPKQAVPFLAERLKPAASVDPQKLERWIADLESEKFAVRQEASASLLKTGEQAVPALQKLLASQPTIETRKRAEELLDKLTGGTLTTAQLQLVRAIEVLERMGTPEARAVLEKLTRGASGALPTRESQSAFDRLARS